MGAKLFLLVAILSITIVGCEKEGEETSPNKPDTKLDKECYPTAFSATGNGGATGSILYDDNYKVTRIDESHDGENSGYTEYQYDSDEKLVRSNYHDDGGAISSYAIYEYNNDNSVSSYTVYSLLEESSIVKDMRYVYDYNTSKQISKTSFYFNDNGTEKLFSEYQYEYNDSNQITRMRSSRSGWGTTITDYQYKDGLLVKVTSSGSGGGKTITAYEYGDKKGQYSALKKANPVLFTFPFTVTSESLENVLLKKLITNESNEVTNEEESFTASYEYNENGYPVKGTIVYYRVSAPKLIKQLGGVNFGEWS